MIPLLSFVLAGLMPAARAAVILGDLAITGLNAGPGAGGESVALLFFNPVAAGETIFFTDNGWKADNTWRTGEGIQTWTTPSISAGTVAVVSFSGSTAAASADIGGSWAAGSGSLILANSGDQLLIYTGSTASPQFLYGVTYAVDWAGDATTSGTSALPSDLVGYSLNLGASFNNGDYNATRDGLTGNAFRLSLMDPTNFARGNGSSPAALSNESFVFGADNTAVTGIPEPSTAILALLGAGFFAAMRRRLRGKA